MYSVLTYGCFIVMNKFLLDIFQQFTFVIKQKEKYTNLRISNNTNRCNRQKQ